MVKKCARRRANAIPGAQHGGNGTMIFSLARTSENSCSSKTSNWLPGANWPRPRKQSEAHGYEFRAATGFTSDEKPLEESALLFFARGGYCIAGGRVDLLFALGGDRKSTRLNSS